MIRELEHSKLGQYVEPVEPLTTRATYLQSMVNAFWLDRDLERAAAWLVDRHVTSSVFECSMVLTTAVQLNGYPESDALYFTGRSGDRP